MDYDNRDSDKLIPVKWGPAPIDSGRTNYPGDHGAPLRGADRPEIIVEPEKSLRDYIDIVRKRKYTAISVCVIILALVVAYAFTRTPYYRSMATIEIQERSGKSTLLADQSNSQRYFPRHLNTQAGVLKSRNLAKALADKLNLAESPEFAPTRKGVLGRTLDSVRNLIPWQSESRTPRSPEHERLVKENNLISAVTKKISVKFSKTSNLIDVGMEAKDPAFARKMLATYLDLYLAGNLEKSRAESLQARDWLQEELGNAEKRLMQSEVALVEFVAKHGIVSSGDGGFAQVMDLLNKTTESLIKTKESRARFQALNRRSNEPISSVLPDDFQSQHLKKLKEELANLEGRNAEMSGVYSPAYPKRSLLRKKIKFLQKRIAELEKNALSSALDTAARQENIMQEAVEGAKKEAMRINALGAQYALLKKNVDTNRELHRIILKEFKDSDIKARTAYNDIRVVDPPTLPTAPSKPKKPLLLCIGLLLGILGGLAAAYVTELMDETVQGPEEIERNLAVPNLGLVPDVTKLKRMHNIGPKGVDYEFIAYGQPKSPFSDAIHNIQSSLFFTAPGKRVGCMAVSSATEGEGKTLIATSLATVLTFNGTKTVLLVDGDLRKPRIHKVFQRADAEAGLSTILSGENGESSAVIRRHTIPGLFYITSGPLPHDPVSLLSSDRMAELLEELRSQFDTVIVDCPPILGFPDTRLVMRHADGVVLVARQGHVRGSEFRHAAETIASSEDCRILGVVLNMAHLRGSPYSYRGYGYERNYRHYGR